MTGPRGLAAFGFVLACLLGLGQSARAQSFDCDGHRSKAERLICDDKALSKLDDALDTAYREALDSVANRTELIATQRKWLQRRDLCPGKACLGTLYEDRLHALAALPRAAEATHHDAALGISFRVSVNRVVRPCRGEGRCIEIHGLLLGRPTMLLRLRAVDFPLERAARDEAGFELENGRWMTTYGRFEPVPVDRFEGRGWQGMKAVVTCGVDDPEGGFHAAAGECLWAVLSNGKRSIIATTDGYVLPGDVTAKMLGSVAFDH